MYFKGQKKQGKLGRIKEKNLLKTQGKYTVLRGVIADLERDFGLKLNGRSHIELLDKVRRG